MAKLSHPQQQVSQLKQNKPAMGIRGLWKHINDIGVSASLQELAVMQGFRANPGGVRGLRIGIDSSAWIYSVTIRHSSTKNPELASLFARCAHLFQLPVWPVFVFDGPQWPPVKRNKHVRGNDHWLVRDFKTLLRGLGFAYVDAPGEAEAQLALLSSQGYIDAVITEDCDAFLFGATSVIRLQDDFHTKEYVVIYKSEDLRSKLGLDHDVLLLIALLVGGDYSAGITSCGISTALALAQASFGTRLARAVAQPTHARGLAMHQWREELRAELRSNLSGCLPRRTPAVAHSIPDSFPEQVLLNYYQQPATSTPQAVDMPPPDVHLLATFAQLNFKWSTGPEIIKRFAGSIFPGLALRELMDATVQKDRRDPFQTHLLCRVVGYRKASSYRQAEFRVVLKARGLLHTIRDAIQDHTSMTPKIMKRQYRAWVPLAVLDRIAPELIDDYEDRGAPVASCALSHFASPRSCFSEVSRMTAPSPLAVEPTPEVIDITSNDEMASMEPKDIASDNEAGTAKLEDITSGNEMDSIKAELINTEWPRAAPFSPTIIDLMTSSPD